MADPCAEFYATGIYPFNHAVIARHSLLDDHPWLELNLSAFQRRMRRALDCWLCGNCSARGVILRPVFRPERDALQ